MDCLPNPEILIFAKFENLKYNIGVIYIVYIEKVERKGEYCCKSKFHSEEMDDGDDYVSKLQNAHNH